MPCLAFNLNDGNEFIFDLIEERLTLGRNALAFADNANVKPSPSVSAVWQLIAAQGAQGARGEIGATGPQGLAGPQGATGPQGPAGSGEGSTVIATHFDFRSSVPIPGLVSVDNNLTCGPGVSVAHLDLPAGTFVVTYNITLNNLAGYALADNSRQIRCSTHPLYQCSFFGIDGPWLWLNGGLNTFLNSGTVTWTVPAAPLATMTQ